MTKTKKQKKLPNRNYATLFGIKTFWILPLLAIVLYANTLTHEYTQDDAIVIYDNMYTTQGIKGIPSLLKYDTFRGFFKTEGKDKLVSGGRYRPLTPVMFAIEYELFGKTPFVGHLINVLLYGFLGILIFLVLNKFFSPIFKEEKAYWLAISTALLYITHPIHTEAVANIKGRDEILAMICSLGAFWFGLKNIETSKVKYLFATTIVFFLGLMSKENTITFLAIWPLCIYFFKNDSFKKAILPWIGMLVATILFLIIRTAILGFDIGGTPMELMNNPFLKLEGNRYVSFDLGEKLATISYTLGKYIQLLVFPHPLTHDYYPRHIELMQFSNPKVIGSILLYFGMIVVALFGLRKKNFFSFGILFFLITISIVSNIIFPIGTNMSERFMFMPSLGFTLVLSYFLNNWLSSRFSNRAILSILGIIVLLYSVKTISRNMAWKNDFTLFTTDVKTSQNSAKILNAAGGALTTEAYKLPSGPKKTKMLTQAVTHLNKALQVHPGYKNAALILGNAHYYLGEYDQAIKAYERALTIAPGYPDAERNLAVVLRDAGQHAGEKERNIEKSLKYLNQSYQLSPEDVETIRLLGVASGVAGDHNNAIKYFKMVVDLSPSKTAFGNLGRAYANSGNIEKAQEFFSKAETMEQ